jgi:hypothetical protein
MPVTEAVSVRRVRCDQEPKTGDDRWYFLDGGLEPDVRMVLDFRSAFSSLILSAIEDRSAKYNNDHSLSDCN